MPFFLNQRLLSSCQFGRAFNWWMEFPDSKSKPETRNNASLTHIALHLGTFALLGLLCAQTDFRLCCTGTDIHLTKFPKFSYNFQDPIFLLLEQGLSQRLPKPNQRNLQFQLEKPQLQTKRPTQAPSTTGSETGLLDRQSSTSGAAQKK